MKISLKWLKEYVDVTIPPVELSNRLTMAGNEVKAVESIGSAWENVVVAQIVAIEPHPNADRLRLATVDLGTEKCTVVCGAPNLNIGDKIAFAQLGAELKDGHTGQTVRLKAAKIRGVESKGMICSERELGLSDSHEGILVLPPETAIGRPLKDFIGDTIIDLDITPNRADCLSVIGIAHEAAALTGQTVHLPEVRYSEEPASIDDYIKIEIAAPELCSRYCASLVTGVKIAPSPSWMQERLSACGVRPINNIVDVTNYVMLEYGQPLHSFDYNRISGKRIIVRRARTDERIITLDNIERDLTGDMLVIADRDRAIALAGVMGGANSDVTEMTTSILLEAANFSAVSIHNTGDALGLASEARYRFERTISAELALAAVKRATQLLIELGEGKAVKGCIDVYPGKVVTQPLTIRPSKLKRLLGYELSAEQIAQTLSALGFACRISDGGDSITVIAPWWRTDIHLEVDLIEEVSRIRGYEEIPVTLLAEPIPQQNPEPLFNLKRKIGQYLVDSGFTEVLHFSLTGSELMYKAFPETKPGSPAPIRLANPMTAEMEYLRNSLRPNLLAAFTSNRRHEDGSIRIFELAKVYLPRNKELPDEPEVLCAVLGGPRFEKSWQDNDKLLDFYDAKGLAEGLLQQLGISPVFEKGDDRNLNPNKQASIIISGKKAGVLGELHPVVLEQFEISDAVFVIELDLKTLVPILNANKTYQPVPRFPSIVRDMALVLNSDISHMRVQNIIQAFPLVEQAEIFDVYTGEQVPAGKKSLAYHVSYRSVEHTLTDTEVDSVQQQIFDSLAGEVGAVLRG
jgi:phenylalanyl-tRNA synthetase beta chain